MWSPVRTERLKNVVCGGGCIVPVLPLPLPSPHQPWTIVVFLRSENLKAFSTQAVMRSILFATHQKLYFTEEQAFWQIALIEASNAFYTMQFNSFCNEKDQIKIKCFQFYRSICIC